VTVPSAGVETVELRDWCAAWLLRARDALYREGWEEGMSEGEMVDALTAVLFNLGCDEGTEDAAQVAEAARLRALPIEYSSPKSTGRIPVKTEDPATERERLTGLLVEAAMEQAMEKDALFTGERHNDTAYCRARAKLESIARQIALLVDAPHTDRGPGFTHSEPVERCGCGAAPGDEPRRCAQCGVVLNVAVQGRCGNCGALATAPAATPPAPAPEKGDEK
jgi:hypothetical protein